MRAARIRELNDAFRARPMGLGRLMLSVGVNERGLGFVARAIREVATFDAFTGDNDPHGEHDFGSFVLDGETLFWKIDYYDQELCYGSEDPADRDKTTRVLTIMLAEEY